MKTLTVIVIALIVPVLLLLVGARLMMLSPYLAFEYQRADFPADDYGFMLADRLEYGPYGITFLVNNEPITYLRDLTFKGGAPFYNERELGHMADVQRVTQVAFFFLIVCLGLLLVLTVFLSRTESRRVLLVRGLMAGALLTLAFLGGMAVFTLVAWDSFFDKFHELFFSAGTWTFNYSDSLIRLYPVRFWQDTAINIGIFAAACALILLAASSWLMRRSVRTPTVLK